MFGVFYFRKIWKVQPFFWATAGLGNTKWADMAELGLEGYLFGKKTYFVLVPPQKDW